MKHLVLIKIKFMNKTLKILISSFFAVVCIFSFTTTTHAERFIQLVRTTPSFDFGPPATCSNTVTTYYSDGTSSSTTTAGTARQITRGDGTVVWSCSGIIMKNDSMNSDSGFLLNDINTNKFTVRGPMYGDKNSTDVKLLQTVILKNGQNIAVDGNFGPGTRSELIRYQLMYRLPGTGTFNKETRVFMENGLNGPSMETGDIGSTDQLSNASSKLSKIKSEISKMVDILSKLSQQALAMESLLKNQ